MQQESVSGAHLTCPERAKGGPKRGLMRLRQTIAAATRRQGPGARFQSFSACSFHYLCRAAPRRNDDLMNAGKPLPICHSSE
jgi:hypothetical protein